MTPLERIQTAIDKLEQLKADSTPGPWLSSTSGFGSWIEAPVNEGFVAGGTGQNTDLIVTLQRTIDAQLNILRGALTDPELLLYGEAHGSASHALALADAILEAAS